MNNDEAMALLVARRGAINGAVNELNRYTQEADNWQPAIKATKIDRIKASALEAGVDIAAWDGSPAPPEIDD